MFDLIASLLAFFYGWVHSYGLAIVLLTLVVMAVTAPFTYKGTKSMIQMQRLQPQLKAIQAKYRDDREKMNQEMLAFYKANNLNPVGGCLPMLIQIPVFLVLYRVVRGLTARFTDVGLQAGWTAMQFATGATLSATPAVTTNGEPLMTRADYFNPAYISHDSELYQDLRHSTEMKSWGIDLSESASKALSSGIVHALPYLVLIAIVLVTGVIQQRQIQGRQAKSGNATAVNSQQQMIMKVMPFFLPIFSFGVPAALVVYFVVSNCWRIGQQAFITHKLYSGHEPAAPIETTVVEDDTSDKGAKAKPAKATPAAKAAPKSAPKGNATERAARSPMGRNRRTEDGTERPARKPAPKPQPKPERAPTTSGRVTPPGGSGSRTRKKKRT